MDYYYDASDLQDMPLLTHKNGTISEALFSTVTQVVQTTKVSKKLTG